MNKKLTKRLILSGTFVLIAVCIAVMWLHSHRVSDITPIASTGGAMLELPAREDKAYFLQADPQWGGNAIGGSGEPLSAVGCTISAVAMAAGNLGYDVNPGELNARLIRDGGYTNRGWLIWSKVTGATEGKIVVRVPSQLTHAEIDQALRGGSIPVVKFFLSGGIPHWVPIVGKTGSEYLIKDSLDSNQRIVALSEKTNTIVSVRYVEKR